jgi:TRAP-type C4-dicarboxylate transport system substrate-binding protein
MTYYDRGGVVPNTALVDGIASNVLQMGVAWLGGEPGRYSLSEVMSLPFIAPSSTVGSLTAWQLFNKFPQWQAQFPKEVIVLSFFVSAASQIHAVKKPIKAVSDLSGLKVMALNEWAVKAAAKMGAIPVADQLPNAYESLSKGMTEALISPLAPIKAYKISEVAKYHTIINFNYDCFAIVMNRSVFESLPQDLQKMIVDASGAKLSEAAGRALDTGALVDSQWMIDQKDTFYALPSSEMQSLTNLIMPIRDEWTAKMEAKGLRGKAVLEEALKTSAQLKAEGKLVPVYPITK